MTNLFASPEPISQSGPLVGPITTSTSHLALTTESLQVGVVTFYMRGARLRCRGQREAAGWMSKGGEMESRTEEAGIEPGKLAPAVVAVEADSETRSLGRWRRCA